MSNHVFHIQFTILLTAIDMILHSLPNLPEINIILRSTMIDIILCSSQQLQPLPTFPVIDMILPLLMIFVLNPHLPMIDIILRSTSIDIILCYPWWD